MDFSVQLEEAADSYWEQILQHPMVQGIGDGSLDPEPFRHWLCQDYYYLTEYSRMFAQASSKAPDLKNMGAFAELTRATVEEEMDLHRDLAEEFGLSREELEETTPSPTTRGYTDFLVRVSSMGSFEDVLAAQLPCMWGFNHIGLALEEQGLPNHDSYARWIEKYASDEFVELTQWGKDLLVSAAERSPEPDQDRYLKLFRTSARWEYHFWEAAWVQEEWEV